MKNALLIIGLLIFSFSCTQPNHRTISSQGDVLLDNSGADGSDGSSRGTSYSGPGSRGSDGEHAQSGRDILIEIAHPENSEGRVSNRAYVTLAAHLEGQRRTTNILDLNVSGKIHLDASGGFGGDGGRGGDGANGQDGRDGRDATCYSSGSNGTDGTDGRAGGRGGDAGAGGDAGNITVRVSAAQTELLLLLGDRHVDGGEAGSAGRGGDGGRGGRGGDGGRSRTCTDHETCTDSEGNRYDCSSTYRMSGGRDGSDGRRGRDGSSGSSERDGNDGKVTYIVTDASGESRSYSKPYNLKLTSYDLVSQNGKGVLEPGDTETYITNLVITNTEQMPTPQARIMIALSVGDRIMAKPFFVDINQSLSKNESITIKEKFRFEFFDLSKDYIGGNKRYVYDSFILPTATQANVNRRHEGFRPRQQVSITFPIEITPINAPDSLAPGEEGTISWRVKNISKVDFGGESELGRTIRTELNLEEVIDGSANLTYRNSNGKPLAMGTEKFLQDIVFLKPGESTIINGTISAPSDAEPYSKYRMNTKLFLEHQSGEYERNIQNRYHTIGIAQTYQYSDETNILLVINKDTSKEEVREWTEFLKKQNLNYTVWDLSYYGHLNFYQNLTENNSTLADDFKKKTIIVLSHHFNHRGRSQTPGEISKAQHLMEVAMKSDVHFYWIGNTSGMNMDQQLKHYVDSAIKDEENYTRVSTSDVEELQVGENWQFSLFQHRRFSSPDRHDLNKIGNRLADRLESKYPHYRYFISFEYDIEKINDRSIFFRDTWSLGNISISRSLNRTARNFVTKNFDADSSNRRISYVQTKGNEYLLYLSLPFTTKLELLKKQLMTNPEDENHTLLTKAILSDLALEQQLIRQRSYWGYRVSAHTFSKDMPLLDTLIEYMKSNRDLTVWEEGKASNKILLDLFNDIYFMSGTQVSFWDTVLFKQDFNISLHINSRIKQALAPVFGEENTGLTRFVTGNYTLPSKFKRNFEREYRRKLDLIKSDKPTDLAKEVLEGFLYPL